MFTRPFSMFTVVEALAVAITETRLAAMAARMGTPKTRVRRGTRKTPPPMPSIAPTTPVTAPMKARRSGETDTARMVAA
jgi:hypothetical protein